MRVKPKQIPSLKRKLISLNRELDAVSERYNPWDVQGPLTELEKMVLLLEDRRFFRHMGVDWRSGARELWRKATFRKHGGASTIEMQFIRTVNNRRERTAYRKAREVLLALLSSWHFNKIALLRSYLDIAFFGSGLIGVESASLAIFSKNASNLGKIEAAYIASMLVYPRPLKPTPAWGEKIARRSSYALKLAPRYEKGFEEVAKSQL